MSCASSANPFAFVGRPLGLGSTSSADQEASPRNSNRVCVSKIGGAAHWTGGGSPRAVVIDDIGQNLTVDMWSQQSGFCRPIAALKFWIDVTPGVTRALFMLSIFWAKCWSGRRDLNSRPPVPQTGALTGLRHAPTGTARTIGMRPCPRNNAHPRLLTPGGRVNGFCTSLGRNPLLSAPISRRGHGPSCPSTTWHAFRRRSAGRRPCAGALTSRPRKNSHRRLRESIAVRAGLARLRAARRLHGFSKLRLAGDLAAPYRSSQRSTAPPPGGGAGAGGP